MACCLVVCLLCFVSFSSASVNVRAFTTNSNVDDDDSCLSITITITIIGSYHHHHNHSLFYLPSSFLVFWSFYSVIFSPATGKICSKKGRRKKCWFSQVIKIGLCR